MKPTREEVIRVARECGLYVGTNMSGVTLVGAAKANGLLIHLAIDDLTDIADHFYEAGAAAEREECAKIAWNHEPDENGPIETAIRNRAKATGETK